MKEGAISTLAKTLLAHAVTVLVTLTLVFVILGRSLVGAAIACSDTWAKTCARRTTSAKTCHGGGTGVDGRARGRIPKTPLPPEDVLKELDPDERNNVRVYAAANKGVVNITTEADGLGFFGDETSTGTGSGFVLDKRGHILTNYHVVQDANSVRVTLFDGTQHDAKVIGADASTDVAVLVIKVAG